MRLLKVGTSYINPERISRIDAAEPPQGEPRHVVIHLAGAGTLTTCNETEVALLLAVAELNRCGSAIPETIPTTDEAETLPRRIADRAQSIGNGAFHGDPSDTL